MKNLRSIVPLVVCLSLAHVSASIAQETAAPKEKENAGVRHQAHAAGPIVVKWPLKKLKGEANLVVNPDGSYLFSGAVNDKKKDRDFNIAVALKSNLGAIYVFRFSGDASNGVQWSKEGKSTILKDNFKSFAKVDWSGEWRLPLSAAGDAKLYAEREKKLAALKKEEEEAKKRHDARVAAARHAEIEKREQEEREEAQAAAKQSSSGGGSSIGSTISGIASTVGSVVNTIGSVGQAIAGLF